MLLARDGHDVTVFERDASPTPDSPDDAWERWTRVALRSSGSLITSTPVSATSSTLSCRMSATPSWLPARCASTRSERGLRPSLISSFVPTMSGSSGSPRAAPHSNMSSLERRRWSLAWRFVAALPCPRSSRAVGLPSLTSSAYAPKRVRSYRSDLVVDATGRRSPLPRWLADAGAPRYTRRPSRPDSCTTRATSGRRTAPDLSRVTGFWLPAARFRSSRCRQTTARGPSRSSDPREIAR